MKELNFRQHLFVYLFHDIFSEPEKDCDFKEDKKRGEDERLEEVVEHRRRSFFENAVAEELDCPAEKEQTDGCECWRQGGEDGGTGEEPGDGRLGLGEPDALCEKVGKKREEYEGGSAKERVEQEIKDSVGSSSGGAEVEDGGVWRGEVWKEGDVGNYEEGGEEDGWDKDDVDEDVEGVVVVFTVEAELVFEVEHCFGR